MAESTGVERMLQRIRGTIENGAYYEAQQMYKTAYYRYKAKNMINESLRVLKEGASLQLRNSQINCGTELGNLLLEGYAEHQIEVNEDSVTSLRDLVLLLPQPESHTQLEAGSAEVEEGGRFLNHIIRWINRQQPNSEYFLEFNSLAGDYLTSWDGGEALGRITIFFVRGKNWNGLAKVLMSSLEMSDTPTEEDLFICRCVLQVLLYSTSEALQNARAFLETYSTIRSLPQTALIHFTEFLIEALEIPSERLMDMLVQKYTPILNRDKHLEHLLKKVKQQFFPRASEGLLSNILGGILQSSTS